ncbi:hypothetical protein BKA81DRAFT_146433 [Phyllosticta paracitricarpa]
MNYSRIFQRSRKFLARSARIGAVVGLSSLIWVHVGYLIGVDQNRGITDFKAAKAGLEIAVARKERTSRTVLRERQSRLAPGEKVQPTEADLQTSLRIERAKAFWWVYRTRLEGLASWMAADMMELEPSLSDDQEGREKEHEAEQREVFARAIMCIAVSEVRNAGLRSDETQCLDFDQEGIQQFINGLDAIRTYSSFGWNPSLAQTFPNNELAALAVKTDGKLQWISFGSEGAFGMKTSREISEEARPKWAKPPRALQLTDVSQILKK